MPRAELTPAGYASEMLNAIHNKRIEAGSIIEMEVAQRKLDSLVDPYKTRKLEDPFIDLLVASVDHTAPLFKYAREDFEHAIEQRPQTGESIERIREELQKEIKADWDTTKIAYEKLPFNPEADPFLLAGISYERDFLSEVMGFLGYQIQPLGEDRYKAYTPQRMFTQGDIETVIRNRVNIGLRRLIDDYSGMYGEIRRPVLRQAITLAQEMVTALRTPTQ